MNEMITWHSCLVAWSREAKAILIRFEEKEFVGSSKEPYGEVLSMSDQLGVVPSLPFTEFSVTLEPGHAFNNIFECEKFWLHAGVLDNNWYDLTCADANNQVVARFVGPRTTLHINRTFEGLWFLRSANSD